MQATARVERPLSPDATPTADMAAVPVTEEEFKVLIAALEVEDDAVGTVRTRGYSRRKATELLQRMGAAMGLGDATMPVTAYEVTALDYVLKSLQMFKRNEEVTPRFATLLRLLTVRMGTARVSGWRVIRGAGGLQWEVQPAGCESWGSPWA
jgi:hypothetical protein